MSNKNLIKMAKKINKLELTEDQIDVSLDDDDLKENFISAIEEIDDDGNVDDLDNSIIDFYESLIDDSGSDDVKEKVEFDEEALTEELEEMSFKKVKDFIEENELEIDAKMKKNNLEDIIEEIVEKMVEKAEEKPDKKKDKKKDKTKDKKKDKTKDKKKDKTKDKKKDKDSSAIFRKGTVPGVLFEALEADGELTWLDAATLVAEEKDGKEPEQCMGIALRQMSRKIGAKVTVTLTFTGDDESAIFKLED